MEYDMVPATLAEDIGKNDHIQGPENAVVMLVEYGDYLCPFTREAHPIVKELQRRSGGWLRFAFRHFPRREKYEHSEMAALAAEAAAAQGMFWEMHDCLLEEKKSVDRESLIACAEMIGLDVDQFERDLDKGVFADKLNQDVQGGKDSGVEETPTFFIEGVMYKGPIDVEAMMAAIQSSE